mmetsp:Transcript_2946/g.3475  ORF Transcript_2946/g.3475 Transcript_2946/m.3475 type:complete len:81 (-) Transcript_2946:51-293(-)
MVDLETRKSQKDYQQIYCHHRQDIPLMLLLGIEKQLSQLMQREQRREISSYYASSNENKRVCVFFNFKQILYKSGKVEFM